MLNLMFSARGRIGRGSYWKGVLVLVALTVVMGILFKLLGGQSTADADGGVQLSFNSGNSTPAALIAIAELIVTTWAGLCLGIKRFHDRDKSGAWVLISLVPLIGQIWYFIEAGCLPGTYGPNRYGLPRGGAEQSALAAF